MASAAVASAAVLVPGLVVPVVLQTEGPAPVAAATVIQAVAHEAESDQAVVAPAKTVKARAPRKAAAPAVARTTLKNQAAPTRA
jgi:hypothetical protein